MKRKNKEYNEFIDKLLNLKNNNILFNRDNRPYRLYTSENLIDIWDNISLLITSLVLGLFVKYLVFSYFIYCFFIIIICINKIILKDIIYKEIQKELK